MIIHREEEEEERREHWGKGKVNGDKDRVKGRSQGKVQHEI